MEQLRILHLSDVHFGSHHRCRPEDPSHPRAGFPALFDLIAKDLDDPFFRRSPWQPGEDPRSPNPLLVVATGDLTQRAAPDEFKAAHSFFTRFDGATLLQTKLSRSDLFVVPGNHDVTYDADDAETRHAPYTNFYSKLFAGVRPPILAHEAEKLSQVHVDQARGVIVVEINSAYYVKKGTADEQRGSVDLAAIGKIDAALRAIPAADLSRMVRVALLHHHPILVPDLVEAGRGYDAVVNSNHLLKLLREFGFHLVLHGHKHYPHVFSYDSDSPWSETTAPAMIVVAGGSAGSTELPPGARRCNSYNLISIKWHPEATQGRVRFVTRGLVAVDGGGELAPHLWKWVTLRDVNRRLFSSRDLPLPVRPTVTNWEQEWNDQRPEKQRKAQYQDARRNMVVSEIMPSLVPGQAYEVRFWVVPHCDKDGVPKPGWEPPVRVIWSAGPSFPRKECHRSDDPRFCGAFNYWGPMLVQAEMHFAEGEPAYAYLYARIPGAHST